MRKALSFLFLFLCLGISAQTTSRSIIQLTNTDEVETDSIAILTLKAQRGDSIALGELAMRYQFGNGVDKDSALALALYKIAIKRHNKRIIPWHKKFVYRTANLFSARLLYDWYNAYIRQGINHKLFNECREMLAYAGNVDAQLSLGDYYLAKKNNVEAQKWYSKALETGRGEALYNLGSRLYRGRGIKSDKIKGLTIMMRAANLGVVEAQCFVGRVFLNGTLVEQNIPTAINYLKKAAPKNKEAAILLGRSYLTQVPADFYFAAQWMAESWGERIPDDDEKDVLAKYKGTPYFTYLQGLKLYYVEKKINAAQRCFKLLEKQNCVEGLTMQAACLVQKNKSKRDMQKAISMYETAIQRGNALAAYNLSSMYETGVGMEKADAVKALELLQIAADGGIPEAQNILGDRYFEGDGVPQDYCKATQLYLKAEAQNRLTPSSAQRLIKCYEHNLGNLPDWNNAKIRIWQLRFIENNDKLFTFLKYRI